MTPSTLLLPANAPQPVNRLCLEYASNVPDTVPESVPQPRLECAWYCASNVPVPSTAPQPVPPPVPQPVPLSVPAADFHCVVCCLHPLEASRFSIFQPVLYLFTDMAWYECLRLTAIDSIMRSFNWAKQRRGKARKGMEKGVFILMNLLELAVELSSDLGHANGALLWDVNYHLRFIKCHAHSQLAFRAGQVSLPSSQVPVPIIPFHSSVISISIRISMFSFLYSMTFLTPAAARISSVVLNVAPQCVWVSFECDIYVPLQTPLSLRLAVN